MPPRRPPSDEDALFVQLTEPHQYFRVRHMPHIRPDCCCTCALQVGATPLIVAAGDGLVGIVRALLGAGADVDKALVVRRGEALLVIRHR